MLYDMPYTPAEIQHRLFTEDLDDKEREQLIIMAGRLYKNYQAKLTAIKSEVDRLKINQKGCEANMDFIKDMLDKHLGQIGIKKVEDISVKIRRSPRAASFKILNEKQIPAQFKTLTATFEPGRLNIEHYKLLRQKYGDIFSMRISKTAMNEWFNSTGEVPRGAEYRDNDHSVVIK